MGEFLSEPIEDKNTTEGKYTSEYISKNLHLNIFKKINEIGEENIEEAIKDAFMQTDNVWKDESSNLCLIKMTLSNSRAVMSVGGLAIPLSVDHKPNLDRESQRKIEDTKIIMYPVLLVTLKREIKINKDLSKAYENLMNKCLHELDSSDNMISFLHGLEKEKWMERISSRCVEENYLTLDQLITRINYAV
ncbi:probable protein phosphatase 2C 25 [Rhizophagus irregularis DAOM 181602=DAOM 197198]|nr:probable protein phosphatase 2C 25 [Rhizophagus irregularis DAOM 181602=DAOM 197198]